jgi:hypothetical protein
MTSKSYLRSKSDSELLRRWREWLNALDIEISAADEVELKRRHKRLEVIQRTIAKTPSEGLVGIGIKLALASFLDGFATDGTGELGRSAYLDTARLLDRNFLAEAEAVLAKSRQAQAA